MRILVGSDLHNNVRGNTWFCNLADSLRPDALVFLGDFITFEPLEFARGVLRDLASLGVPALVIPGNCDPRDLLLHIDQIEGVTNLHNRALRVNGFTFVGRGGSITCPSPTPFEEPDESFAAPLEPLIQGADVLVVHQPARGFRDRIAGVGNVGSESLLKLIAAHQPRLVLSGHIHEAKGLDVWGQTTFVNPGALLALNAAVINLGQHIQVDFKEGDE